MNMPSLTYAGGVIDFRDPYQTDSLDQGDCVFMALAENKLMWADVLKPRVLQALQALQDSSVFYVPMQGQVALRRSVSAFLERRVTKVPGRPDEVVCCTGVSALLSNLFYCLCEDGDLVLIPAPYYSAFDSDLRAFCNLRRVLVPLEPATDYRLTVEALEAAYLRAREAYGREPKALLLTNPHNPLGRIMARDELEDVLGWCGGKGLHLVSDEIYALSCFSEHLSAGAGGARRHVGATEFVSVAEVCGGQLSDHVHVIWGVSKDLGMAGVRVGAVWSQNGPLLEALRNAAKFAGISGPIQAMVADLLADTAFVDAYLLENARRLGASCEAVLEQLERAGINFVMPAAGMFVWVDLRPLLPGLLASGVAQEELEGELHERLVGELRIVITPGAAQHANEPGWFRICYASVPLPTLVAAMTRFSDWVLALRASSPLDK